MKKVFAIILTLTFLFSGCEKLLKDLGEKDVDVANVDFESEEIEVYPSSGNSSTEYHDFKESQDLSLDNFEGTEDLKKYSADLIKSVSVEKAEIVVFSPSGEGGLVKDFTASVNGLAPYTIPGDYTLGTIHSDGMKAYIEKVLYHILTNRNEEISMSLTGTTNLPETVRLKCKMSIKGIKVKVKMVS
jgi:hypothetical protein